jgi:hypothetical protein
LQPIWQVEEPILNSVKEFENSVDLSSLEQKNTKLDVLIISYEVEQVVNEIQV